jgi:hypothetical protein
MIMSKYASHIDTNRQLNGGVPVLHGNRTTCGTTTTVKSSTPLDLGRP